MDQLTSFPTAIFTVVLAFCLAWWVISLVFGIGDGGDTGDVDVDGDIDGSGDGFAHHLVGVLGSGPVPIPLAISILAAGAWAASLILHAVLAGDDGPGLALGIGLVVIAVAVAVGLVVVRIAAKPLGRLFHTHTAPTRREAIGSVCRIRTVVAAESGQAEVVNGGLRGSLISVHVATGGTLHRGDHALVVDYDAAAGRYLIAEIDEELLPDP